MDRKYKFGALALVALVPLLIAASGGFPSRPRFVSIGVGTAAPATAGQATFTGTVNANGGNSANNIVMNSTTPSLRFIDNDAALDSKNYYFDANGNAALWQICNDAIGACREYFRTTRASGSLGITSMAFGNATDNPTYSFLGTGAVTIQGQQHPKHSRGSVVVSGSCSSSGTGVPNGACGYIGAGIVSVSLASASYTATPICVVALSGLGATTTSSIFVDSVSGSAPNYTLNVSIRKNGTAPADGNFYLLCLGV